MVVVVMWDGGGALIAGLLQSFPVRIRPFLWMCILTALASPQLVWGGLVVVMVVVVVAMVFVCWGLG